MGDQAYDGCLLVADRLEKKASDLRKTITHAEANDSGWCDTAPLSRWEEEHEDLTKAVQILRDIPGLLRTRNEVMATCSRVNTELQHLKANILHMVKS